MNHTVDGPARAQGSSTLDLLPMKAFVRVRPFVGGEDDRNSPLHIESNSITVDGKTCSFDHVFPMDTTEEDVYNVVAKPLTQAVLGGYNTCLLAHGQTGAGKTHTMGFGGERGERGVVQRFIRDLFSQLEDESADDPNKEFMVDVCHIEAEGAAKTEVSDLLSHKKAKLKILADSAHQAIVQGLTQFPAKSADDAIKVLRTGCRNRRSAATDANTRSSRTHAVFSVSVTRMYKGSHTMCAKASFVDLAGNEKAHGSHNTKVFKEGAGINTGLLVLRNVLTAIKANQENQRTQIIPFRNSALTRVLANELGGNSRTAFIACVSPAHSRCEQTKLTLQFVESAMSIKTTSVSNVVAPKQAPTHVPDERHSSLALERTVLALEEILKGAERDRATLVARYDSLSRSWKTLRDELRASSMESNMQREIASMAAEDLLAVKSQHLEESERSKYAIRVLKEQVTDLQSKLEDVGNQLKNQLVVKSQHLEESERSKYAIRVLKEQVTDLQSKLEDVGNQLKNQLVIKSQHLEESERSKYAIRVLKEQVTDLQSKLEDVGNQLKNQLVIKSQHLEESERSKYAIRVLKEQVTDLQSKLEDVGHRLKNHDDEYEKALLGFEFDSGHE